MQALLDRVFGAIQVLAIENFLVQLPSYLKLSLKWTMLLDIGA